jgi:transposase
MLSLTGYRLMLWIQPTDMRIGVNGLSGIVCNEIKEDPFRSGTIYAFFNARRTTVKMLTWDGDGFSMAGYVWYAGIRRSNKDDGT